MELRAHEADGADGKRQAQNETCRHALKRLPQHQHDHLDAVRTERHPDADFVRLLP